MPLNPSPRGQPQHRGRRRWAYGAVFLVVLSPITLLAVVSSSSKRPEGLGVVNGQLSPGPDSPNCVSSEATDADHRIAPIPFDGPNGRVMQRLRAAIATLPRSRVVEEKEDYMHVEVESLVFRFVDDVEFFVDRKAKVTHIRSASRVGRSDLGVNRARMERLRRAFEDQGAP